MPWEGTVCHVHDDAKKAMAIATSEVDNNAYLILARRGVPRRELVEVEEEDEVLLGRCTL